MCVRSRDAIEKIRRLADQLRGERGQARGITLRRAHVEGQVLAFDVTETPIFDGLRRSRAEGGRQAKRREAEGRERNTKHHLQDSSDGPYCTPQQSNDSSAAAFHHFPVLHHDLAHGLHHLAAHLDHSG